MTREEARKAAEVMLAYAKGEEIEFTIKGSDIWQMIDNPSFNLITTEYRIKSKQKFDPNTLKPFDRVLVFDDIDNVWSCDFYSHKVNERDCFKPINSYRSVGDATNKIIPYNEDTKHLIGTTEEAPEYYRHWEE